MRNPFNRARGTAVIVPNQDFLDGTTKYLKGESYTVDAGLATVFLWNGWLEGDAKRPSPQSVKLDIQNSELGHESRF